MQLFTCVEALKMCFFPFFIVSFSVFNRVQQKDENIIF